MKSLLLVLGGFGCDCLCLGLLSPGLKAGGSRSLSGLVWWLHFLSSLSDAFVWSLWVLSHPVTRLAYPDVSPPHLSWASAPG